MRLSQNLLKNPRAVPTPAPRGRFWGWAVRAMVGTVPQNRIKEWFWLEGTSLGQNKCSSCGVLQNIWTPPRVQGWVRRKSEKEG